MKLLLTHFFVFLFALSCGTSSESEVSSSDAVMSAPEAYEAVEKTKEADIVPENAQPEDHLATIEQKIIKTGNFTFETQSVNQSYLQIKKWVGQQKGLIQSDQTYRDYNRLNRNLIIRIPTEGFQKVIDSLKSGVKAFDVENIELQDVTEEFVDIQARMKAKKELETRYLQLLSKANTVKDMLEIEAQLATIREAIEAQEGRLKYLQNRVSYSTINLTFYEVTEFEKSPSQGYFSRLGSAFSRGFNGIGEFIIGLVTLWPLLLSIGIFFFWLFKYRKSKSNKKI